MIHYIISSGDDAMDGNKLANIVILSWVLSSILRILTYLVIGESHEAFSQSLILLIWGFVIEYKRKQGRWFWD